MTVEQASANIIAGYQYTTRLGFSASTAVIIDGKIKGQGFTGDVGAGFASSLSANYLPLFETETRPFVSTSASLSFSSTTAVSNDNKRHPWVGTDLRLGLMIGKTFFGRLVPYAAARVFGGPVSWNINGKDVTGSDIYHYTVGTGLLYQVPGELSFFAEALAIGEKSLSLGGSLAF